MPNDVGDAFDPGYRTFDVPGHHAGVAQEVPIREFSAGGSYENLFMREGSEHMKEWNTSETAAASASTLLGPIWWTETRARS
jgi:hypothetical protein